MRTLVSAVSIGLVAVSGMAYSLQATRPAASSSSHAPEAATMPDEHVGISVLQTDTFQDPAPPDSVGPKISRVDYYEVERAPTEDGQDLSDTSANDLSAPVAAPASSLTIAALSERAGANTGLDQPAEAPRKTKQRQAKTASKKPSGRESRKADRHREHSGAAPRAIEAATRVQAAPAPSSTGLDFPNPIPKLRQFIGMD
jgi:hypothetical protein